MQFSFTKADLTAVSQRLRSKATDYGMTLGHARALELFAAALGYTTKEPMLAAARAAAAAGVPNQNDALAAADEAERIVAIQRAYLLQLLGHDPADTLKAYEAVVEIAVEVNADDIKDSEKHNEPIDRLEHEADRIDLAADLHEHLRAEAQRLGVLVETATTPAEVESEDTVVAAKSGPSDSMPETQVLRYMDRADWDRRAHHFRDVARKAGYDIVADAMPLAEGPGIVHLASWRGEPRQCDDVFSSWEDCCAKMNLSSKAWAEEGNATDILAPRELQYTPMPPAPISLVAEPKLWDCIQPGKWWYLPLTDEEDARLEAHIKREHGIDGSDEYWLSFEREGQPQAAPDPYASLDEAMAAGQRPLLRLFAKATLQRADESGKLWTIGEMQLDVTDLISKPLEVLEQIMANLSGDAPDLDSLPAINAALLANAHKGPSRVTLDLKSFFEEDLGLEVPTAKDDAWLTRDLLNRARALVVPEIEPQDPVKWQDRAEWNWRSAKFRDIARAAGYDVVYDAMPWAEGPGIVHLASFAEEANVTDSVYAQWEYCCWERGLSDEAEEAARDEKDILARR